MAVFDDMELERKVTVYEKAPWKRAETYGEWQTRSGDIYIPKIPTDEPLRLECQEFLRLVHGEGDRRKVANDGAMVVRALERLTDSLSAVRAVNVPAPIAREHVVIYSRHGASARACHIADGAVVGKQPALSPRSTAKREPLPPLELGAGTIVSTGAIVFAGHAARRARDRRRPGLRARARHGRRRRRHRPRLAGRERHDDRRA